MLTSYCYNLDFRCLQNTSF